jgi:hypothetical protein
MVNSNDTVVAQKKSKAVSQKQTDGIDSGKLSNTGVIIQPGLELMGYYEQQVTAEKLFSINILKAIRSFVSLDDIDLDVHVLLDSPPLVEQVVIGEVIVVIDAKQVKKSALSKKVFNDKLFNNISNVVGFVPQKDKMFINGKDYSNSKKGKSDRFISVSRILDLSEFEDVEYEQDIAKVLVNNDLLRSQLGYRYFKAISLGSTRIQAYETQLKLELSLQNFLSELLSSQFSSIPFEINVHLNLIHTLDKLNSFKIQGKTIQLNYSESQLKSIYSY